MSQYFSQISRYFRQSLIDTDRLCPKDKDILPVLGPDKKKNPKGNYLAITNTIWQQGRIASNLAEQIIQAQQPNNKPPLQQLEILLFPRVDLLKYQGGAKDKRKRDVLLPLVVFINLQRNGTLLPSNKAPWIPRIWVNPTQDATKPFTEITLLDAFLTLHPFEGIETWTQLTAYCTRLLCHATTQRYKEQNAQKPATQLAEIAVSSEYDVSDQCLLQLCTPVVGAKKSLHCVLDFLLDEKQFPKLYQTYCNKKNTNITPYADKQEDTRLAIRHVGQMSGEFSLSVKQRNALHHFIELKSGQILAINGPPGTGKTTLLRSVVANLWTQAALNKGEPPLIMATSNNNQAVTNILESFARIDETGLETNLMGRWLPELDSYGLYFCAKGKANQNNPYRYMGPDGNGCMKTWQTQAFVNQAQTHFLDKITQWSQTKCNDLDDALLILHKEMRLVEQQIRQSLDSLNAWKLTFDKIEHQYGSIEALQMTVSHIKSALIQKTNAFEQEKTLLDKVYQLWASRKWWITLLMWLPSIRKQEAYKTSRLLHQWGKSFSANTDDELEIALNQKITYAQNQIHLFQHQLTSSANCLAHFLLQQEKLNTWLKSAVTFKLLSQSMPERVAELNDRYYRFRLFKLASHYFEARWLKETKTFVESHNEDKKSPIKLLRKLRRYAKLTPCFVSTFYMLPNTFMAGKYKDKNWIDLPQLNEIDLLIVDESGQALPDVSAASFALAKKALIVGDTDQIEPVWSIPASIDRSNLALFDLLVNDNDYERWLDSGLLASSGNVMRVAQRQNNNHQFEHLQRGLYLTEHRRCFDNIISYCNDLVYQGMLEPQRGNNKENLPWGAMALYPVYSPSQSFGGSRGNPGEAKVIANWLKAQSQTLLAYAKLHDAKYQNMTDAEVLRQNIGIITPFKQQASLISNALRKKGIEGLTVGTVHSLQGDERLIVLFSSVYGENNKGSGKFYDAGTNMLNVAVSRAKDSFIVFGDPNVFGVNAAGSPSALLRQRLVLINAELEYA